MEIPLVATHSFITYIELKPGDEVLAFTPAEFSYINTPRGVELNTHIDEIATENVAHRADISGVLLKTLDQGACAICGETLNEEGYVAVPGIVIAKPGGLFVDIILEEPKMYGLCLYCAEYYLGL